MEFSFDNHINNYPLFAQPHLDLFAISQSNAAFYEPTPSEVSTVELPSSNIGKQKKQKKRRSTDGKPYPMIQCSECPKTYRDNNAGHRYLQLHMTTHDPEAQSKYACDKCSKTFSNESYLQRHWHLCGVQKKRRSSISSSTHDESSSDTVMNDISTCGVANDGQGNTIEIIDEEPVGEVQIDFQAF